MRSTSPESPWEGALVVGAGGFANHPGGFGLGVPDFESALVMAELPAGHGNGLAADELQLGDRWSCRHRRFCRRRDGHRPGLLGLRPRPRVRNGRECLRVVHAGIVGCAGRAGRAGQRTGHTRPRTFVPLTPEPFSRWEKGGHSPVPLARASVKRSCACTGLTVHATVVAARSRCSPCLAHDGVGRDAPPSCHRARHALRLTAGSANGRPHARLEVSWSLGGRIAL